MINKKEEVAKPVIEEPDDKPAGFNILRVIVVAVIILTILYFIIFY